MRNKANHRRHKRKEIEIDAGDISFIAAGIIAIWLILTVLGVI